MTHLDFAKAGYQAVKRRLVTASFTTAATR
jgi:hypothetical protein